MRPIGRSRIATIKRVAGALWKVDPYQLSISAFNLIRHLGIMLRIGDGFCAGLRDVAGPASHSLPAGLGKDLAWNRLLQR